MIPVCLLLAGCTSYGTDRLQVVPEQQIEVVNVNTIQEETTEETVNAIEVTTVEETPVDTTDQTTEETVIEKQAEAVEHFIKIISPEDRGVFDGATSPIVFKGEVSEGATKIVVTANFSELNFETGKSAAKQDVYELTGFQPGDTTFEYSAKDGWNNLGLGENTYTFAAYFQDDATVSTVRELCYQMEVYYPPSCW